MKGAGGFTLIEVLVGLALTGIVVAIAYRTFGVAIDTAARLDAAGISHARAMNARRWLSAALGSVDVTRDTGDEFVGHAHGLRFASWLQTGDGWFEPARVSIEERDEGIVARAGALGDVMLFPAGSLEGVDYLARPGGDSPWLASWESAITAPVAIRFRVAIHGRIDTLLLRVGERG